MLKGIFLSPLQSTVMIGGLTDMALLPGIVQVIIAPWLTTQTAAAAMVPSALVVAKDVLKSTICLARGPKGILN